MTVKEIKPKMFCLEYRQEPGDKDYGSCLYARFMFNLDRYELSIISDCGNYGHKWVETPSHESFLQLMARIDEDYLIRKIYGSENIFDYEKSKMATYQYCDDGTGDTEALDELFGDYDFYGIPESAESFCNGLSKACDWIDNPWLCVVYEYPPDVLKIASVFENYIKPAIKIMLQSDLVDNE